MKKVFYGDQEIINGAAIEMIAIISQLRKAAIEKLIGIRNSATYNQNTGPSVISKKNA